MQKAVVFFKNNKYIAMGIVLLLLLVILIFVLITGNSKNSDSANENTSAFQESHSADEQGKLSGDSKFLVVCCTETTQDVLFISLIDFKIYSETVVVTPLSNNTPTDNRTYLTEYQYGGILSLKTAVENTRNCVIDRYVVIDKEGFCDIADILGEVSVNVKEPFTYASADKNYSVAAGKNNLDENMLFAYTELIAKKNDTAALAELLCVIIDTYISGASVENSNSLFEQLANCINSDISISDYYSANEDINHLLTNEILCIANGDDIDEK